MGGEGVVKGRKRGGKIERSFSSVRDRSDTGAIGEEGGRLENERWVLDAGRAVSTSVAVKAAQPDGPGSRTRGPLPFPVGFCFRAAPARG
jgi:hypothetical protein